jgi:hypothetical protein
VIKLILKTSLVFGLINTSSFRPFLLRNYSATSELPAPAANRAINKNFSPKLSESFQKKTLNSLKPLKIYSSLQQPSKRKQLLNDLTGQGGIMLFLSQNSSLYAIEGSNDLANYLTTLFNKEYLKYLASIKSAKKPKSHYQELLKSD